MTPERERLVFEVGAMENIHAYWQDFFPLNLWQQFKWGWRARQAKRALAAYDAAHPEEAR